MNKSFRISIFYSIIRPSCCPSFINFTLYQLICQSFHPSILQAFHFSILPFFHPFIIPSFYPVHPSILLSFYPSILPSFYSSINPSLHVHLSIFYAHLYYSSKIFFFFSSLHFFSIRIPPTCPKGKYITNFTNLFPFPPCNSPFLLVFCKFAEIIDVCNFILILALCYD